MIDGQPDDELDGLIHRADLDGLVRLIDARCAARDWVGLLRVRGRTRSAVATGRQLWPAATLAEYRLALWAPAKWAAQVLDEDSGRFTIGPLTEVVAVHHTLASLVEQMPVGPRLGFVAHERALRGEVIDVDLLDRLGVPDVLDLPLAIQPWEPNYAVAGYTDDGVTADPPPRPAGRTRVPPAPFVGSPRDDSDREPVNRHVEIRQGNQVVDDPVVTLAVRQLLDSWTASSDARVEVVCVEGAAADAVGALGVRDATLVPLTAAEALAWLAWAGASGGAHGRRRGLAIGRFGAWWLTVALADGLDEWPLPAAEVGEILDELRWYWWDAGEPSAGWELQLAVEDSADGYAWAISAHDA